MNNRKVGMLAALMSVLLLGASVARAESEKKEWNEHHPRRAQVNRRLAHENKEVNQDVKSGKMTQQQAKDIRRQERAIRVQERRDAARHGGHITKGEQRRLNREENKVHNEIKQDEQGGSAAPAQGAPAAPPVSTPAGQ